MRFDAPKAIRCSSWPCSCRSRCSPPTRRSAAPPTSCSSPCSRSRFCAARSSAPLAGFGAGLLIDTANLGTLGFTSLLLTLAGFWIGRYGETTARDRFHAPFTSVGVVTILYAFGALALRFVLGDPAPAGAVLSGLPAAVLLNLLLTWPVYAFVRRLFPPIDVFDRVHEVRLLG